jgi:hypothetical protein
MSSNPVGSGGSDLPPPVTFFVAPVLLQDEGVLAGRSRHGFCPQSFMIRGCCHRDRLGGR